MNIEMFAVFSAIIIVVTKLILNVMEERDLARGIPVNHKEYTFSGLLSLVFDDFFRPYREKRAKRKQTKQTKSKNSRN